MNTVCNVCARPTTTPEQSEDDDSDGDAYTSTDSDVDERRLVLERELKKLKSKMSKKGNKKSKDDQHVVNACKKAFEPYAKTAPRREPTRHDGALRREPTRHDGAGSSKDHCRNQSGMHRKGKAWVCKV